MATPGEHFILGAIKAIEILAGELVEMAEQLGLELLPRLRVGTIAGHGEPLAEGGKDFIERILK
jgi:hypothetical protein